MRGTRIQESPSLRAFRPPLRTAGLVRQWLDWRGEESFFRWLSAIARHVVLELAVQEKRQRAAPVESDMLVGGLSESKAFRRQERFDRLQAALSQLDLPVGERVISMRTLNWKLYPRAAMTGNPFSASKPPILKRIKNRYQRWRHPYVFFDLVNDPDETTDVLAETSGTRPVMKS